MTATNGDNGDLVQRLDQLQAQVEKLEGVAKRSGRRCVLTDAL